jgi:hypothetical protein
VRSYAGCGISSELSSLQEFLPESPDLELAMWAAFYGSSFTGIVAAKS